MFTIAQIGCGYWGPNLLRNFQNTEHCEVVAVADPSPSSRDKIQSLYPNLRLLETPDSLFTDPSIDGLVIAAPARFHYELTKTAIESGKDVLVEKPLALTYSEGKELVELAFAKQRILMVGHILEYHPAILKIQELLAGNQLGKLQHLRSTRLNLGKIRHEENVLWSFAPHDIAIIQRLTGCQPTDIQVTTQTHLQEGIADTVHADLKFSDNVHAHLHVSWLEPVKEQKLTVVGDQGMCTYDDVTKQLLLYPHHIDPTKTPPTSSKMEPRQIPFHSLEPLAEECRAFLDAIRSRNSPLTDGQSALAVLHTLETIQSLLVQD